MSEILEEEFERQNRPQDAVWKMLMFVLVITFATMAPLYLWAFSIIEDPMQAGLFSAIAGIITFVPVMVYRYQQVSEVTGLLFFKPFTYFKQPGLTLPEDQAQIRGRITPIREGSLSTFTSRLRPKPKKVKVYCGECGKEQEAKTDVESIKCVHCRAVIPCKGLLHNPLDKVMAEVEGRKHIKGTEYLIEEVLQGKSFAQIAKDLEVSKEIVAGWWLKLGGAEDVEKMRTVLQYPNRYLIEFADVGGLDATILCAKSEFSSLGLPQEREDLQYKGWFVSGRAIPMALHELRSFSYAGVRMSVTVPGSCDEVQRKIMESAEEFNVPDPDAKLDESAIDDYDKGYVGITLKRQLGDADQHVLSLTKGEHDFEERVKQEAERYYQEIEATGKKKGRLARMSRGKKIALAFLGIIAFFFVLTIIIGLSAPLVV